MFDNQKTLAALDKFIHVVEELRSDHGCPWDKEQTHQSLRKNLLEESHEVIEAIDSNDMEHLKEELGDLLLQIVFHAKLAEQEGAFNFNDVVVTVSLALENFKCFGFITGSDNTVGNLALNEFCGCYITYI